jgi:hypothetical protein
MIRRKLSTYIFILNIIKLVLDFLFLLKSKTSFT